MLLRGGPDEDLVVGQRVGDEAVEEGARGVGGGGAFAMQEGAVQVEDEEEGLGVGEAGWREGGAGEVGFGRGGSLGGDEFLLLGVGFPLQEVEGALLVVRLGLGGRVHGSLVACCCCCCCSGLPGRVVDDGASLLSFGACPCWPW